MAETKVSLKLLIDTKANKVLFSEASKDFVDFLLHILSLPVGSVVKLLEEKSMVGCLSDLCRSVGVLDADYLMSKARVNSLLNPSANSNVPLLTLNTAVNTGGGYVKSVVTYMVMDNLEVKPMSTISGITLMNKFHVKDVALLMEKEVEVGLTEGLAMLKASFETKDVLSTVFLGKKK
ncbi:uncharacterized protein [Spinacia oleracea]|uniref:DUF674 domain-containing protein n=1 Tax=Spinacia oleracea TaxID=3562 RepID=A0A9R0JI73_SPIOL|nr:uncharacterized protein LOC110805658 [Spinacia oleracea]